MQDLNQLNPSLNWKTPSDASLENLKVTPQCLVDGYFHFIGADGTYYPCCYMRSRDGRKDLKELLGEDLRLLNISEYSQHEILISEAWNKLTDSFKNQPTRTCLQFCKKETTKNIDWGHFNGINTTKAIKAKVDKPSEQSDAPEMRKKFESEILYNSLTNLGDYYPLNKVVNVAELEQQLVAFKDHWRPYNPREPLNKRLGLSLISLDGGMRGAPDLDVLLEYNRHHKTEYCESDFSVMTPALQKLTALNEPLEDFFPYLGRTHLVELGIGGFFPFQRRSQYFGDDFFQVIAPLAGCDTKNFCFIYNNQRVFLEPGRFYFINTKIEHSFFAFAPARLLFANMSLSQESLNCVVDSAML